MWREGYLAVQQWRLGEGGERAYSVCRHCSGIWVLEQRGWITIPFGELCANPLLGIAAAKFAAIRKALVADPMFLERAEQEQRWAQRAVTKH